MPASTSTSSRKGWSAFFILALAACLYSQAPSAHADDTSPSTGPVITPSGSQDGSGGITTKPEDEDYSQTPYTEYGAFNEEKEEEEDTQFFQYGRFFGLSLGVGIETADGNRGTLYQGGWPTFDAKIHYWFDFNFALDIDFYYAQHYFVSNSSLYNGRWDVNMVHLGVDLKYYFDTKNLSSAISFANPYLLVGVGNYTKTLSADQGQATGAGSDSAVGFNGGAGLEFALKPRKVYFTAEARIHVVSFSDNNTQAFAATEQIPDLHGNFYTFIGSILFTW